MGTTATPAFIICKRAAGQPPYNEHDVRDHCVNCRTEVWITTTGQQQRRSFGSNAYVLCHPCGDLVRKKLAERGNPVEVIMNPAAGEAAAEALRFPADARPPTLSTRTAPSGVPELIVDYRGTQNIPDRPLKVVCDFCTQPSARLWGRVTPPYSCAPFWDHKRITSYPDWLHWWACVYCNRLLDPIDLEALIARALIMNKIAPEDIELMTRVYRWTYQAALQAWTGVIHIWESGQRWPVKAG